MIKLRDKSYVFSTYPDGKIKYIYINENNEFVVRGRTRETIYHYNEDTDDFEKEIVSDQNRDKRSELNG